MATQDGLVICLNALFDASDPSMEKSAEAAFMDRLTREHEDADIFTDKFVKLAGFQGENPWRLAYRVAFSYPELEKAAAAGMPLARYYLEWADDLEKRAFLGAVGRTAGRAWQGVKGLFKGAPKTGKLPASQPMAGAKEWEAAQANFARMTPPKTAPKPPGASVDTAAVNQAKGYRSVKDIKASKGQPAPTGGQAPAGGGAPAGGAPAAGQQAGQGVNWGNVGYGALGGAAMLGAGGLGYMGYKAIKGPGQAASGGYYGR